MPALLIILVAYLLGSVPFSYIITHIIAHVDIRAIGNGNAGAKNTTESVGLWAGISVAMLDIGKGALAVLMARQFSESEIVPYLAGVAAVLGHDFPIYLRFKGGQGMAALAGTFVVFMPQLVLISAAAMLITLVITRSWDVSCGVGFVLLFTLMLITRQSLGMIVYSLVMLPTLAVTKLMQKRQARTGQV
jgi:glycerol-3-phosphate acyltransferase PlsY